MTDPDPIAQAFPTFESWTTAELGRIIEIARVYVREAQAAFQASQQAERRLRKRTVETEAAEMHAGRLEDELELMRTELRRRTIGAVMQADIGELMR